MTMFNESWIRLTLLMVLVGVLLHAPSLVLLAALLLAVIPVAWVWNRASLWHVSYDRILSEQRVFAGETVNLTVRVNNHKFLPLVWVRVEDEFPSVLPPTTRPLAPSHLPLTGLLTQSAALGGRERARWDYSLVCGRRGFFNIGPARLRSGDGFGLYEMERVSPHRDRLIVYPRVLPMEEWNLPPKDPLGDVRARLSLIQEPTSPRGVREYLPSDAPKHIHWRLTARRGALQVKVYDPTVTYEWVLFLNVATFAQAWQGVQPELLERVISLAASIASNGVEHRLAVGLIANGTWPDSDQRLRILPSRNPDQLRHILEALAAVTSFVTLPIETLLRRETPRLSRGGTLVMITGVVTDELLEEMARLHDGGRRLALVSLDENWEPRELEGIIVRQASPAPGNGDTKP